MQAVICCATGRASFRLSAPIGRPVVATALLAAALAMGCSDDGGDDDGKKVATVPWLAQNDLDEKAWKTELGADDALAAEAKKVTAPFLAAGDIEDTAGAKIVWAEFAKSAITDRKEVKVVFKSCDKDANCTVGSGSYTATGASLVASDGSAVTSLPIGVPSLAKRLKTSNLDAGTVIATGLNRNGVVEPKLAKFQLDASTWGKRRMLIINRFGEQMGVPLTDLLAAANKTGLFTEIIHLQYARRRDIDAMLPQMTPLDVVVWVGAGVVKPFGNKPYRSVGMTLSRGIVGDVLYHHQHLGKILDQPPLGGPGLVLLAGSNSLTANLAHNDVLGNQLNLSPARPVVGIEGEVTVAEAEAGAIAMLNALAVGDTLDKAMKAAEGKLDGALMRTPMLEETTEKWKLAPSAAKFWDKAPSSAKLEMYVKVDPACADISGAGGSCDEATFKKGVAIPPAKVTPILDTKFVCELKFTGPYFECTVLNPTIKADFSLKGALVGRNVGESVFLFAQGQSDGKVRDMTVIGAGEIKKVDAGGGTTVISFSGPAAASTFINQDGQCCIAKAPLLSGHSSNLLSKLTIKP